MKKIILCILLCLSLVIFTGCEEGTTNNNGNTEQNDDFPSGVDKEDKNEIYEGNTPYAKIARHIREKGKYVYNPELNGIGYQLDITDTNDGTCYLWLCVRVIRFVWQQNAGRNTRILFFKLTEDVYNSGNFVTTFKEIYHSTYRRDFFSFTTLKRSEYIPGMSFSFEYQDDEYFSPSSIKSFNESCCKHLERVIKDIIPYLEANKVTDRTELGFTSYE